MHKDPNTYYIKPMEEKGLVKTINRCQLYNLGITEEEQEQLREAGFATGADSVNSVPVYIPNFKNSVKKKTNHGYALRSLGQVADPSGFCQVAINKVVTQSTLIIQKCVVSGYPLKKVVKWSPTSGG